MPVLGPLIKKCSGYVLNILEQLFSWRVREVGRRKVRDDVRLHNCSTWSESALALRNHLRKLGKGEGCGW